MPGAEVLRLGGGWTMNPGWRPPIIGPGDRAWVWVEPEQPIESLRGEWRALSATATITNADKLGIDDKTEVRVTSRDVPWSDINPGEPRAPVRLWARVLIPSERQRGQLAHKPMQIKITLKIVVPEPGQDRVVEKELPEVSFPTEVRLARPFAAFLYSFFWYIAMLGGAGMFLLAAGYHLLSDAALRNSAPPTRVSAVTEEDGGEPVPVPNKGNGDGQATEAG